MAEGALPPTTADQKKWKISFSVLLKDARHVFKMDHIGSEILSNSIMSLLAMGLAAIVSLVDTALIGRIGGPVELAAVGVSIAIFNQAFRIIIFPLVIIATSFVAEEADTTAELEDEDGTSKVGEDGEIVPSEHVPDSLEKGSTYHVGLNSVLLQRRHIPYASTVMVLGLFLGFFQMIILVLGAKPLLNAMGVKNSSPMMKLAYEYLKIRAFGSPAVFLSLAMQGIFQGFKHTKTPFYATVVGDTANAILDPTLSFACHMGVGGAAIAHVISQYFRSFILLWRLMKEVDLVPIFTTVVRKTRIQLWEWRSQRWARHASWRSPVYLAANSTADYIVLLIGLYFYYINFNWL